MPRLHADEVELHEGVVRRLIDTQFPEWAPLRLRRLTTTGTDNAIFRLGDDLGVRVPRLERAVQQIDRECRWIAPLAARLPVRLHEPVAVGQPDADAGYPFPFLVFRWIDGVDLGTYLGSGPRLGRGGVEDPITVAIEVAAFVRALQAIDAADGPSGGARTRSLSRADRWTRPLIRALDGEIDVARALAVWDDALAAGDWDRPPVWVHGDLLPGNVLVADGHAAHHRLVGVIDWSSGGVGDPACDAMLAWALPAEARAAYREALDIDDRTWRRGRGWVIEQTVSFIPYYRDTIPEGVALARARLDAVLAADE